MAHVHPTRGDRRYLVEVLGASASVPDGEGGWTTGTVPMDPPTWRCQITPASVRDLETAAGGTTVARATHIATGDHHPGITTAAQLRFTDVDGRVRTLFVNGVAHPEERGRETVAFCEESTP